MDLKKCLSVTCKALQERDLCADPIAVRVVNNHGFVDAKKRTGWILVETLIERSGYHLSISDDEPIDDLVVAVAKGDLEFDALRDWFGARLVR